MDVKKEFLKIMSEQNEIALATSVNNIPNVRIEMESNSHIAFTTIPHSGNEHVKAKGLVQKSTKTIFEVAEQFIAKVPGYKNTIEFAGESSVLFEIRFDTAIVTKDLKTIQTIEL